MDNVPILTVLVFLPILGSIAILFLGERGISSRVTALVISLCELAIAGAISVTAPKVPIAVGPFLGFFLVEDYPWIERFGIRFTLGMDGITLLMVMLTALLVALVVLFSWNSLRERVTSYHALLLLSMGGIVGVFLALDLFLFYLFWEIMLIPLFFLIFAWGGDGRVPAALRFFLYTIGGSLLMLLAVIVLYLVHGQATGWYTFSLQELVGTPLAGGLSCWLFAAFLLAFAVKTPLFPLHGWLPDTYAAAPTAATVLLAGLMAKTGVYGLIRFAFPLFPEGAAYFTPLLLGLSVAGILYASWLAFAQTDVKRVVAYSSFGHMGFVALGIAAWSPVSLSGSILQMVNHGITTGALFLMTGMLEERAGSREIASFGGLWGRSPLFAALFLLFSLSAVGLPGLNNFAGEFLILAGAFRVSPVATSLAFCGMVLVLVYMLRLVQGLLFGPARVSGEFSDLSRREAVILITLALLVVLLGVYPAPALDLIVVPAAFLSAGHGGMP